MKLLLRRDQKSGMMGKVTFLLDVRAEISDEERRNIDRYKFGDIVLFQNYELGDRGSGLLGWASRAAIKAMNISISVNDLVRGKRIDCKSIIEMIAAEEQIREACHNFKAVLETAAHFGGEEVVEI